MEELEQRVRTAEQSIIRIDANYEHLATKADLAQLENRLLKWLFGLLFASVASGIAGVVSVLLQVLSD